MSAVDQGRRAVLRAGAAGALLTTGACATAPTADPWSRADSILARFATPLRFRDQDFVVTAFGAAPCKLRQVKVSGHGVTTSQSTPVAGSPDCHRAIADAIAACSKAGGGRVLIPTGSWYCAGPIVLRSNVHVHLAAGAQVYFSADPRDYARHGDIDCGKNGMLVHSRWQGNDVLNFSPLVYAKGQTNIAITGADWTSILDGQGGIRPNDGSESWWEWTAKGRTALPSAAVANPLNAALATVAPHLSTDQREMIHRTRGDWRGDSRYLPALSEADVPLARRIFGLGHYLRPCMIEFIECTDVLMQGYQITGSPFWLHHPVSSRNVRISKVRMDSMGPNNDGFDPESCDTVLVDQCVFNTGDDCIAIKAGKNRDVREGPTRNVLIQDCVMNSGHGGVTLGSEMAAGIEHVYAQRIEFRNIHWASDPLGTAIRLKTNMNRGGFLRHLYARDLTVPNGVKTTAGYYAPVAGSRVPARAASTGGGAVITIDCDYAKMDDGVRTRPPSISDIHISNLKVGNVTMADGAFSCYQAIAILGPVADSFNGQAGTPILPVTRVTITDCDFGTPRAPTPWFLHNVQGLQLKNVQAGGKTVTTELSA